MKPVSQDVTPSRVSSSHRGTRLIGSIGRRTGVALLVTALLSASQAAHAFPLASSPGARAGSHLVTLLTGERVLVGTADGRPTLQVIRSAQQGATSQLTTASVNGTST